MNTTQARPSSHSHLETLKHTYAQAQTVISEQGSQVKRNFILARVRRLQMILCPI